MKNDKAITVAKDMIATYGPEAERIVDSHVLQNVRDEKTCGVKFWSEVGVAVRTLAGEELRREPRSDPVNASRPA